MLERGFVLNWVASNCSVCDESGGRCGFNHTTYQFKCFCPDRPHARSCKSGNKRLRLRLGLGFGVGCLFAGMIFLSCIYGYHFRKRRDSSNLLSMNSSSDPSSKADLEGDGLGYNSDEKVKRMTTSVAELAFQCLHHDKEMRPSMENVLHQLKIIQGGESLDNLEEVHDDNNRSTNTLPPPSPPYCDEAVLLKNILPPPSPVSVTAKWASSSSATPIEIV
ncbi:hypothetical protein OIU78_004857 [Salix suchowensis]|nr:hypothetical protein OIU78_004857 [Salix suchowensis]